MNKVLNVWSTTKVANLQLIIKVRQCERLYRSEAPKQSGDNNLNTQREEVRYLGESRFWASSL